MSEVSGIRVWANEISQLFSACRDKEAQESDVYGKTVDFLRSIFGSKLVITNNQVLLLKIMSFINEGKSYLGYSASDADIVMYPLGQEGPDIKSLDKVLHREGQYGLGKWNGVYPAVIGQVIVSTQTGKLQLENMKAQAWRNMFPRALIIFMAGPYREKFDIRFDREMSYFDLVLVGFENRKECEKNLKSMQNMIESHLRVNWFDDLQQG